MHALLIFDMLLLTSFVRRRRARTRTRPQPFIALLPVVPALLHTLSQTGTLRWPSSLSVLHLVVWSRGLALAHPLAPSSSWTLLVPQSGTRAPSHTCTPARGLAPSRLRGPASSRPRTRCLASHTLTSHAHATSHTYASPVGLAVSHPCPLAALQLRPLTHWLRVHTVPMFALSPHCPPPSQPRSLATALFRTLQPHPLTASQPRPRTLTTSHCRTHASASMHRRTPAPSHPRSTLLRAPMSPHLSVLAISQPCTCHPRCLPLSLPHGLAHMLSRIPAVSHLCIPAVPPLLYRLSPSPSRSPAHSAASRPHHL